MQEFKVLTSNFSAENQKGPVVITSVTKSGGRDYHGSAFFSARNHCLNANDWLNNFSGVQAACELLLLSRRHHRRPGAHPGHRI